MQTKKEKQAIEMLVKTQKTRSNIIRAANMSRSNCLAFITSNLGYNSYQDKKERDSKWKEARLILESAGNGTPKKYKKMMKDFGDFILSRKKDLEGLDEYRVLVEKQMIAYTKELSVCEWWNTEKGRSFIGLALIVGEAGDLSNYANPAKLWKRFGVAVLDGIRQGGLPKGSPAEQWIEHGYNKKRRSVLWNISDSLMKTNGKTGKYKQVYDEQKKFKMKTLKKKWIADGNKAAKFKPGHAHNCALRYMGKRLLRDLWNEWNKN